MMYKMFFLIYFSYLLFDYLFFIYCIILKYTLLSACYVFHYLIFICY